MNATVTWKLIKEKDNCDVEFYVNGAWCAQTELVEDGEMYTKDFFDESVGYIENTLMLSYYDEIIKDYVKEML